MATVYDPVQKPLVEVHNSLPDLHKQRSPRVGRPPVNVLFAHVRDPFREDCVRTLKAHDYHVATTDDPFDALRRINKDQPRVHVLVIQQEFPQMVGTKVLDTASKITDTSGLRVVLLAGDETDLDIRKAKGVDIFLKKPTEPKDVLEAVRKLARNVN